MNHYEQSIYSAGWAARKAFKPRKTTDHFEGSAAYELWLKGYDDCEQHWKLGA